MEKVWCVHKKCCPWCISQDIELSGDVRKDVTSGGNLVDAIPCGETSFERGKFYECFDFQIRAVSTAQTDLKAQKQNGLVMLPKWKRWYNISTVIFNNYKSLHSVGNKFVSVIFANKILGILLITVRPIFDGIPKLARRYRFSGSTKWWSVIQNDCM